MTAKTVITVGVADMKVSNDPNSSIITYALGSCIGVVAYDGSRKVGGLLHLQLPESQGFETQAQANPHKFADTGIPAMLETMYRLGATKNHLLVGIFGGANMLKDEQVFQIGIRNIRAAKKFLWQQSLFIKYENVGGTSNRTVTLDVETGHIRMKKDGEYLDY
jgi:chemotaxis protein CheD